MPAIGFLSSLSQNDLGLVIPGFLQGLNGAGFIEGRSIAIEYRWAQGDYQRLPALSADLVNRKVAVIAAISGTPAALAAKAATTTIPIVFAIGGDPIAPGLVTSLSRPGGNVTGVRFYSSPVVTNPKQRDRRCDQRADRDAPRAHFREKYPTLSGLPRGRAGVPPPEIGSLHGKAR